MKIPFKNIKLIVLIALSVIPIYSQVFLPPYVTNTDPPPPDTSDPPQNDPVGKPYGGGPGYFPIYDSGECDVVVNSNDFNNLKTIVENANYGDVIYVNDNLNIEIPAYSSITIPNGVTLASGRGNNGSQGALFYLDYKYTDSNWYHHIIAGNDVRITGLRLRGPNGSNILDSSSNPGGIYQYNGYNLEVDNCELYNWYWIAIRLVYSTNANIHHNYIHNNQKPGAGYGIQVGWTSSANISYNIFNYNRHSISGNGFTQTSDDLPSYTAEYNLVLPCAIGTRFDMHGFTDECDDHVPNACNSCNYWESCNVAGESIEIHKNTFIPRLPSDFVSDRYMIMIRGIPKYTANITNNNFGTDFRSVKQRLYVEYSLDGNCPSESDYATIQQATYGGSSICLFWGKLDVPSNNINVSSNNYAANIYIRQIDWGGDSEGFTNVAPEILFSASDTFEYGDFNSDGRTDIINQGFISYSGFTEWEVYTQNYTVDPNHNIDFNGDGEVDNFRLVHPTELWPYGCY